MKLIKKFVDSWFFPVIIAVILTLLIKEFLFFNIKVPSESMFPTIKPGDRIFVTRVHNTKNLKRGDIIVFHSKELKEDLIKRLIGLPGDTVEVKPDQTVYVNSKKVNEPYVVYNGGKSGNYKVPKDCYFFLGDNRGNSKDSRYWENPYINKNQIKGKGRFILYPFSRWGKLK